MDAPTRYKHIHKKAWDMRDKYDLSDTQTLLYNHICMGDYRLRNEDGQLFYDPKNNGFGWSGDRNWVKRQFKKLIDNSEVVMEKVHDCRDGRYTSWYFFSPEHELKDLIDASCYVSVHKLALIKECLNLPHGFDRKGTYGDMEFIKRGTTYSLKYKGESNIYTWDYNGKGEKQNFTYGSPVYREDFQGLIHDVWSFLAHDGFKYGMKLPNYTERRQFSLPKMETT